MRRAKDFYPSPEWAAKVLVDYSTITGAVFECCVGEGDLVGPLRAAGLDVITNDVDPARPADFHLDAARPESWRSFPPVSWVVTNPPFSLAPSIVPLAYAHATQGIAMLLRLSYHETCENRGEWLKNHPPSSQISIPRISFTRDGRCDNVITPWLVWQKGRGAIAQPFVYVTRRNIVAIKAELLS